LFRHNHSFIVLSFLFLPHRVSAGQQSKDISQPEKLQANPGEENYHKIA